jgi:hypothetical protein
VRSSKRKYFYCSEGTSSEGFGAEAEGVVDAGMSVLDALSVSACGNVP